MGVGAVGGLQKERKRQRQKHERDTEKERARTSEHFVPCVTGAKVVYVTGQLVFTVGMAVMAAVKHKVAVVLLSPTAGIMYATLFTMPYLLVAHYHTSGLVRLLVL